jgi:hypothetical protein
VGDVKRGMYGVNKRKQRGINERRLHTFLDMVLWKERREEKATGGRK